MPKVKKSVLGGILEYEEDQPADIKKARKEAHAKLIAKKNLPEKGQEALEKLLDEYDKLVDEELEKDNG